MRYGLLIVFVIVFSWYACENNQNQNPKAGETVVAHIDDEYLYLSQIPVIHDAEWPKSDSINFLNNYRTNWLQERLLLQQAKLNLSKIDREEIERNVRNFETESYRYRYEKKFIQQRFDTINLNNEIDSFYSDNIESYKLEAPIIRFLLVSQTERVNEDSIKKWISVEEEHYKIEDLCSELLIECHLDKDEWYALKSLSKIIDISEKELIEQLKEEELVLLKTEEGNFFCFAVSIKEEGEITPLSFVEDEIRTLVINKRKVALIGKLRKQLYEEALQKGKIEVY